MADKQAARPAAGKQLAGTSSMAMRASFFLLGLALVVSLSPRVADMQSPVAAGLIFRMPPAQPAAPDAKRATPPASLVGAAGDNTSLERAELAKGARAVPVDLPDEVITNMATQVFMGTPATGWTVDTRCFSSKQQPVAYGVGCGEDISWDLGMVQKFGFDMFLFDPTPKSIRYVEPFVERDPMNLHFIKEGMAAAPGTITFTMPKVSRFVSLRAGKHASTASRVIELPVNTLRNWMDLLGHTYLDVLKIDIEGSEYDVLENMMEENWFPMTQLLVEFHERFLSKADKPRHAKVIQGILAAGFRPFFTSETGQEISFIKVADLAECVREGPAK